MRCRLRVGARWIALAGGVILESVAGTPYAFGVFAPALKDKLHYTQAQIDAVGSVGNIGQYTAIMAGLVYDSLGPRITGVGGAALSLLGYGFLWSASAGLTGGSPAATSGAAFFAFMGASWFDQLAVCAAAENFPRDAGVAIGLTKSLLGLSASLCTTAYQNLFEPDVTRYLGFLALCVPAVGLIFSSLVTVVRNPHLLLPLSRAEATKVGCAYAVVVLTAVYVAVVGLLQSTGSIGPRPVIAYVVVPLVLAQLLLACPVPSSESPPTSGQRLLLEEDNDPMRYTADTTPLDSPLLQMTINEATDCIERRAATVSESLRAPAAPAGAPFAGALLCLDFWLVFIVLTVGTGAGLTVINNVASLGESLGGGQPTQDLLVTLTSIANCVGRMAGGAASDGLARWLHRPGWLACNVALMAVAQVGVGFFFLQGSPPLLSFTPTLQAALAVSPLAYVYPGILLAGL